MPAINTTWLKDLAERVGSTFAEALAGALLAGLVAGKALDLSLAKSAVIAGIAAALAVVKGAIGSNIGNPASASLLPQVGKHRRHAIGGLVTDGVTAVSVPDNSHVIPARLVDQPAPVGYAGHPHGLTDPIARALDIRTSRKALGRRPPKNTPALRFADHLTAVPAHPITDLAPNLSWPMDHNDTVGCCVVAGIDHFRQVVYTLLGGAYAPWTDAQLLALYQTQNPRFRSWSDGGGPYDGGMDIQTLLEYLVKQKIILGFAKVDHTSVEEMKSAVYLGLGVITGEILTSRNMQEQVWDYHPSDRVEGGHCTVSCGYHPTEDQVSWGALYSMTDAFLQKRVEEAWFVITQAHVDHPAFRAGFDLASFAAAYQEITGATFPVPVTPAPAPVPVPTPAPAPVPSGDPVLALVDPATLAKITSRAGKKAETPAAYAAHALESYVNR